MEELLPLIVLSAALIVFLALGVRVAFALLATGIVGLFLYLPPVQMSAIGLSFWNSINNPLLAAVPLFIWMGEVFARGGLSGRTYNGIRPWVSRIPGGLVHSNIVACALFAAASGSSVGTAAAMGRIAGPEVTGRGYPRPLSYGSLAAGGTLGILIPPSLGMIIFGVLTGTSIGQLFIAGLIPGLVLGGSFMLVIMLSALRHRERFPDESWPGLLTALRDLVGVVPLLLVIVAVLGSLYFGITTPSESAAVGVIGMIMLPILYRSAKAGIALDALKATVPTTAMVLTILVGAGLLSHVIGYLGIPQALSQDLASMELSRVLFMTVLGLGLVVMGMFLDPISVMALTLPIIFPAVEALDIDPIWFGVFITVTLELGLITPPVGLNLFIIKGAAPDSRWSEVVSGSVQFMVAMAIFLVVLYIFPQLATWLPSVAFQ